MKGQINFIEQGFDRGRCIHDSSYPCTIYWAKRTMQDCGDGECNRKCCKGCNELCGYRCNASSEQGR